MTASTTLLACLRDAMTDPNLVVAREALQAIIDRHYASSVQSINGVPCCQSCNALWPCPDRCNASTLEVALEAAETELAPRTDYPHDEYFTGAVVRHWKERAEAAEAARDDQVIVPERLARMIRMALDHGDQAHNLAEQLIACDGYRIDKEPWEASEGAPHV